jgi:hypothetical protein
MMLEISPELNCGVLSTAFKGYEANFSLEEFPNNWFIFFKIIMRIVTFFIKKDRLFYSSQDINAISRSSYWKHIYRPKVQLKWQYKVDRKCR